MILAEQNSLTKLMRDHPIQGAKYRPPFERDKLTFPLLNCVPTCDGISALPKCVDQKAIEPPSSPLLSSPLRDRLFKQRNLSPSQRQICDEPSMVEGRRGGGGIIWQQQQ